MAAKEVYEIMEEMKQHTKTNAYSLEIETGKAPGFLDSKFGGIPYWDMDKPYPTTSQGSPLMLLAQINLEKMFAEIPPDPQGLLPQTGMLQFFIQVDSAYNIYGMDFEHQDIQEGFRVVYHEKIDCQVTPEQVERLQIPVCAGLENTYDSPLFQEAALKITRKEVCMGEGDYRFGKLFGKIAKEKFGDRYKGKSLYDCLESDEYDKVMEEFGNEGHWLLGYPYFTQEDPREDEGKYKYYDTLLFQMDSDYGDEDYVLWGDCGVGNFFIHQEDLKKRDFRKVLYNWDCC